LENEEGKVSIWRRGKRTREKIKISDVENELARKEQEEAEIVKDIREYLGISTAEESGFIEVFNRLQQAKKDENEAYKSAVSAARDVDILARRGMSDERQLEKAEAILAGKTREEIVGTGK